MSGPEFFWRAPEEFSSGVDKAMKYLEDTGQATWTKLQRGFVDAATGALNTIAASSAAQGGISPAAAAYAPSRPEDMGIATEAYSPEARAREASLGTGMGVVTDVLAGAPTAALGAAGVAADMASGRAEAERSGLGPVGQGLAASLAAAPVVGGPMAARAVGRAAEFFRKGTAKGTERLLAAAEREIGGGAEKAALAEFNDALEATIMRKEPATIPAPPPTIPAPALADELMSVDPHTATKDALLEYRDLNTPLGDWSFSIDSRPDYIAAHKAVKDILSERERSAVNSYAGMWYEDMNQVLRGHAEHGPYMNEKIGEVRNALDKAVAEGLSVPGEALRGVSVTAEDLARIEAANEFGARSFMSTTLDPAIAQQFAGWTQSTSRTDKIPVLFRLRQRSGVPIGSGEAELLLRDGTMFRKTGMAPLEIDGVPGYVVDLDEVGVDRAKAAAAGAFVAGGLLGITDDSTSN